MALAQGGDREYIDKAKEMEKAIADKEHTEEQRKKLVDAIDNLATPGKRHEAARTLLNELGSIEGCRKTNIEAVPFKDRILHRNIGVKLSEAQESLREIVNAYDTLKEKEMGSLVKGHKVEEEYWGRQVARSEESISFWNDATRIEELKKKIHEVLDYELRK